MWLELREGRRKWGRKRKNKPIEHLHNTNNLSILPSGWVIAHALWSDGSLLTWLPWGEHLATCSFNNVFFMQHGPKMKPGSSAGTQPKETGLFTPVLEQNLAVLEVLTNSMARSQGDTAVLREPICPRCWAVRGQTHSTCFNVLTVPSELVWVLCGSLFVHRQPIKKHLQIYSILHCFLFSLAPPLYLTPLLLMGCWALLSLSLWPCLFLGWHPNLCPSWPSLNFLALTSLRRELRHTS